MNTRYQDSQEGSQIVPLGDGVAKVFKGISSVFTNWGWAIAFFVICVFNGWVLNLHAVAWPAVVYFAIFPLGASAHIFSKKTEVLVISHMISHIILALVICYVEFSSTMIPIIPIIFYGVNLLFFAFILAYVTRENGLVIPVLILCSAFILKMAFGWQSIGRIVWYCNLTFTANKGERKMKPFIGDFDIAILAICGISAVGLAVGWRLAGIFP